jgi:hypothetical protein
MSKLYLRITFYAFISLITIGCLFILFFSHPDNLARFVPAEATLYLHSQNNFLDKLPNNQKNLFLAWLEKKSTLTQSQWDQIIKEKTKEFALFTINGQFFGLTETNPNLKNTLEKTKISFTEVNNHLYIPAIKTNNTTITKESWYTNIRKHFNLSSLTIYLKNPRAMDIPTALINTNELPVVITNTTIQKTNCYNLHGQIGFTNKTKEPAHFSITPDTKIYFNNFPAKEISQKVDYTLNNFPLLLLKTLKGSMEFVNTTDNFAIRVPKKENSLKEIQNNIKFILAQTKPSEKEKLLPDETIATQLIADSTQYLFSEVDNNHQQIKLDEQNFEINIKTKEKDHYIFSNSIFLNTKLTSNSNSNNPLSHKTNQGLFYLNPTTPQATKSLPAVWLLNKNPHNISICIE